MRPAAVASAQAFPPTAPAAYPPARRTPSYGADSDTYFRNVGPAGLTVFGAVSGVRYQFRTRGAVLSVDPRDAASLARVPQLQAVVRR
jgi:hypothetical protein